MAVSCSLQAKRPFGSSERLAVGCCVMSSISFYLLLSPFISFPLITDPAPIPAPAWVGDWRSFSASGVGSGNTLKFGAGRAQSSKNQSRASEHTSRTR